MSGELRNIKLVLQYDGTGYAGFQIQPNGITVQQVLEEAIGSLTGGPVRLVGMAGRTDAGVHARGQVVNFRTASRIPLERWPMALNTKLPEDVVVVEAEAVPPDWHARFAASGKLYRYTIDNGPFPLPTERLYAYHWPGPLDLEAMAGAAAILTGRHDFAAFRSTGGAAKTSVRHLRRLDVAVQPRTDGRGQRLEIWAEADGFLYNMVRILAGTLLEVGNGRRTLADVEAALQTGQRTRAGRTLPPHGLCLEQVFY